MAGVFGAVTNGSADVIWEEILLKMSYSSHPLN